MRVVSQKEVIPDDAFYIIICNAYTGHVFSVTAGWLYDDEEDFAIVFKTEEEAREWIARKVKKSHNLEIWLCHKATDTHESFYSENVIPPAEEYKKSKKLTWKHSNFWKFWKK